MAGSTQVTTEIDPEIRRRVFVLRALLGLLCSMPFFASVGFVQTGFRRWVTFGGTGLGFLALVGAVVLLRRGWVAEAVHLVTWLGSGMLVGGMLFVGNSGYGLWVFVLLATFATSHATPRRMLLDFAGILGGVAVVMMNNEPLEPTLYPTFLVVLGLVMAFGYFHAEVTEANYADIHASNDALRSLTADLERATRIAESANDAKSAFLATISHELRTPLNAVLGYTAMVKQSIEDDEFEPEEALEDLGRVELAARRLTDQVSRILDITRLEVDDGPALEVVELTALLTQAAEPYRALAEEKGLTFELSLGPKRQVCTDPSRLERLVANLLDNAVRFTEVGRVALLSHPRDGREVVAVADTGVGIDAGTLETMFEPFTQADQSTTRTVEGTGLGLYLVRRLGETMQADLDIRSEVGEGTTVELVLPRAS